MPQNNIAEFLEKERNLGKVIRFSARSRIKDESVAEHSFHAAFYSMLLADMEMQAGKSIDVEKLLRAALLHDLEECVTGDIMHTFKYSDRKASEEIKRISAQFFSELMDSLPEHMGEKYKKSWSEAKSDTIEGKILMAADRLEALLYAMHECSLGNSTFQPIVEEIKEKIRAVGLESANRVLEGLEAT